MRHDVMSVPKSPPPSTKREADERRKQCPVYWLASASPKYSAIICKIGRSQRDVFSDCNTGIASFFIFGYNKTTTNSSFCFGNAHLNEIIVIFNVINGKIDMFIPTAPSKDTKN
jgi:hypothetical protein